MVESEASASACGLVAFSTVSVAATLGEFRNAFRDKCETMYPAGVCSAAASELWDGQDTSAKLASPGSEFCVRLRRVVDAAQRSALAGEIVDTTGLNAAMSQKVKSATQEELSEEKTEGESGVAARFTPDPNARKVCVEDEWATECALPGGLNHCPPGDFTHSPLNAFACERAGKRILEHNGTTMTAFKTKRWPRRPPGCSVRGSRVFYNENRNGKNKGEFDLVCVMEKDHNLPR